MKVIIDIPDDIYDDIKQVGHIYAVRQAHFVERVETITQAIANGTPLPKGHGRIIDYGYVVDAIDDWVNAEEYRYTNATDYLRNRVRNVPTIIEADKGEE